MKERRCPGPDCPACRGHTIFLIILAVVALGLLATPLLGK